MRSELAGDVTHERNKTLRKGVSLLGKMAAFMMCALLLCVSHVAAQGNTADVLGNVTDISGGVVPNATVTLLNVATNISQTAKTNSGGDYTFTLVQVGTYTVTVQATGFKKYSASNLAVSAGDRARVDAKLELGDVTQTVEVTGTVAPALQTDSSAVSTLVTQQSVQDVPLDGRNVIKLIQLSAGTTAGDPGSIVAGHRPDDRRQTSAFSVNGQGDTANNQMIDGADNNERIIGSIGVRPSVDAIEEVNVETNTYSAEFGRTGGGVVNLVTKSGTNSFHGSAYEFFRNKVLNANSNYQFPRDSPTNLTGFLAKPAFRQNQYGGSLGGPIKKNKTFFFGDYEEMKQAVGLQVNGLDVPTLCERGTTLLALQGYKGPTSGAGIGCPDNGNAIPVNPGDFSDSPSISPLGGGDVPCDGKDTDPVYGSGACPYVVLDPTKFDRQGLELFSLYPLPSTPGLINNFATAPARTQDSKTFDIRIDHHISDKDTFFGRYSFNNLNTVTPDAFPAVTIDPTTGMPGASGVLVHPSAPGSNAPMSFSNAFPGPNSERQQGLTLSYVHIFTPSLVVNVKAGYLKSTIKSVGPNYGSNVSNKLGFPCNAVQCLNLPANQPGSAQSSGLVGVNFDADVAAGNPTTTTPDWTDLGDVSALPLLQYDNSFQYSGSVTSIKGSHSIKIGLGLIRRRASIDQSMAADGEIYFDGIYTGEQGGDLLYGLARGNGGGDGWRGISLVSQGLRSWEPSAYIQDDWRVRKWLTLNLGVRYDIFTPYTEIRGRISNFNQSIGLLVSPSFAGLQSTSPTDGVNTDYKDIAPRFGFAATLPHKMVVRGGFGMSFFPTNYESGYTEKNPPYTIALTCQTQQNVAAGQQPPPCVAPFASSAVANYGNAAADGFGSYIGQTGGAQLSQGLPVPTISIKYVQAPADCNTPSADPTSAACTTPLSAANPNGNPYAGVSLNNLIPSHFPAAYLEQFNLMVQKEIGDGNVVTVGWVGEFGHRDARGIGINALSNWTQTQLPQTAQFPWLNSATNINENSDNANSAYNALQATFVRRFNNGLTVNFNYTWAHALGTSQSCQPLPASVGFISASIPCFYDNVANPASPFVVYSLTKGFAWGNTGTDVKDRFAWTVDYQVPFGKSLTGVAGAIAKGWTINSAGSWQSGLTFSAGERGPDLSGFGGSNPDQICSGALSNHTLFQWWNPACFKGATQNTVGNEHAGQLYGPPQRSLDGSLFKEFQLMEALKMQFRVEVFNLFNTPNFANPGRANASISGVGAVGGPPGSAQISAETQGSNRREVQLALKLLF